MIDCLLKNTEIVDAVKAAVEYIGVKRASEEKPASLESIYEELRKAGVEIDLGSVAHIYQDVLSSKDHPSFNTRAEVNEISGRYFDDLSRGLILREDKKGEQQISELSPAQAAVKALTRAFTSPLIKDERTKSILKTMQDAYTQWAKKMVGKTPEEVQEKKDTRTFEQIVQQALDKESLGYTDKVTGELNSFTKLHEGAKEIMKRLGAQVKASGDKLLEAQWDEYAKSLENATRTLMLSTKEGKKVLHESLMTAEGGGYMKQTRDGNMILDHQKLAGEINSITQYRDNVIKALTASGFSKDEAQRVSDSLQKEYHELRGKSLEILHNEQTRKQESYQPKPQKDKVPVGDIVRSAIKKYEAYKGLSDEAKAEGVDTSKYTPELTFSKTEAARIMDEALKASDYGKTSDFTQETAVDWKHLAMDSPDQSKLQGIIADHLVKNEGLQLAEANVVANNLLKNGMHDKLMEDINTHSKQALDVQQNKLDKEMTPVNKSEMTRLAELYAMGLFDGAHDDLLHHVLGIDGADQNTRKRLMELFSKKQQLINQLGAHEFIYHTMDATLQHEVNQLIENNIADKTKLSKIAKAIFNYQAFVNMGIIANPFNIAENTISGFQANTAQTIGLVKQMGLKQGVKIFYEMNRLWAATLKDVAHGGIHYGLESGKFSQSSGIADKLTFKNWDKLNAIQKIATVAIAYAHLGLNAMDSAYKVSIHQKTTMMNLHKALTEVPDENGVKMTRDEANAYLNEKLFGQSLNDARTKAENIYQQLGLKANKNNIERSARELVQANIFSDGQMDSDHIEAAVRGAYEVAAVGLGHQARPDALGYITLAPMMKALQSVTQRKYDKLIKEENYNGAAAFHIAIQSGLVNGVFKFAHGVANWMLLRPLTAGLGLVTGTISKTMGKSGVIDWNNAKNMQDAFYKQAQANADINRAMVGISMLGLQVAAVGVYGMLTKKDDKKDSLDAGFEAIKKNPILNKAMNKFGSDVLMLMYSSYNAKQGGKELHTYANAEGFLKYVESLTNVGTGFSNPERVEKIGKLMARGNKKSTDEAAGQIGELLKGFIPTGLDVPFYRAYKGAWYLGKSGLTGKAELPPFYKPQSQLQGLMDNGVFNDIDQMFNLHLMYPKAPPVQKLDFER